MIAQTHGSCHFTVNLFNGYRHCRATGRRMVQQGGPVPQHRHRSDGPSLLSDRGTAVQCPRPGFGPPTRCQLSSNLASPCRKP
eukprot:761208-Hanusia_phi.AAC.1